MKLVIVSSTIKHGRAGYYTRRAVKIVPDTYTVKASHERPFKKPPRMMLRLKLNHLDPLPVLTTTTAQGAPDHIAAVEMRLNLSERKCVVCTWRLHALNVVKNFRAKPDYRKHLTGSLLASLGIYKHYVLNIMRFCKDKK